MAEDVIAKALREAAKVACFGGMDNDNCDQCLAASQCISHHSYQKATAAAVETFLRAPGVWAAIMEDYEAVTKVVTRAASEDKP